MSDINYYHIDEEYTDRNRFIVSFTIPYPILDKILSICDNIDTSIIMDFLEKPNTRTLEEAEQFIRTLIENIDLLDEEVP